MVRIAKPCSHHSDAEIVLMVVSSDDQKKLNVDAGLGLRAATRQRAALVFCGRTNREDLRLTTCKHPTYPVLLERALELCDCYQPQTLYARASTQIRSPESKLAVAVITQVRRKKRRQSVAKCEPSSEYTLQNP